MITTIRIVCAALVVGACSTFAADKPFPAEVFDLREWKLQIPGPREIKDLRGHSSKYFFLNENKEMCFDLDAAEKGATENTRYVRSELRHTAEWTVEASHSIFGEVSVASHLSPDKVTVLQIHGITESRDHAPPLLRIAVQKGDLYALVKTEASGDATESVLLKRDVKTGFEKIGVAVKQGRLTVSVNGQEKLARDIRYWKFRNYFKAGCYPQATQGTVRVTFRKLSVE